MIMNTKRLVRCAMVAALYTVLCLALIPFSYGAIQVRLAEILCLLPVFGAEYIVAVTLGCFLSNLLGSTMVDVLFGTVATLLACLVTYQLRNFRIGSAKLAIPSALPPILFNALIVGALELTFFIPDAAATLPAALWNAFTVGLGEVISCGILGVLLVYFIEKNPAVRRLFADN
ncbi:MAG: QueT transporter family protein [Candidatus Fournierella pullistercoris]|uniref:QueT transporter family protein n=1 Tax=Candidatus Allofournierella pullistercoris TaxID=2838597 RepID=A0A948WPW8_9FIRM|nr:QueT transporter family protein [Candidatus Fournierella pullistercoris]